MVFLHTLRYTERDRGLAQSQVRDKCYKCQCGTNKQSVQKARRLLSGLLWSATLLPPIFSAKSFLFSRVTFLLYQKTDSFLVSKVANILQRTLFLAIPLNDDDKVNLSMPLSVTSCKAFLRQIDKKLACRPSLKGVIKWEKRERTWRAHCRLRPGLLPCYSAGSYKSLRAYSNSNMVNVLNFFTTVRVVNNGTAQEIISLIVDISASD